MRKLRQTRGLGAAVRVVRSYKGSKRACRRTHAVRGPSRGPSLLPLQSEWPLSRVVDHAGRHYQANARRKRITPPPAVVSEPSIGGGTRFEIGAVLKRGSNQHKTQKEDASAGASSDQAKSINETDHSAPNGRRRVGRGAWASPGSPRTRRSSSVSLRKIIGPCSPSSRRCWRRPAGERSASPHIVR
jgi:hypothetical protein